MKMHYATVRYLQQWVNLNFDRSHFFFSKKEKTQEKVLWAFLLEGRWEDGEDVTATTLNQCDIISGGLWSGRRLIFSLQHQSFHARSFLPPHPVTERHPHFPRCSRISSVSPLFLLKAPHLNSSGLTLTRHCCRRIYQCALSSIFYLPAHQGLLFPSSPLTFIGLKNSGWI